MIIFPFIMLNCILHLEHEASHVEVKVQARNMIGLPHTAPPFPHPTPNTQVLDKNKIRLFA